MFIVLASSLLALFTVMPGGAQTTPSAPTTGGLLDRFEVDDEDVPRIDLPSRLLEISGLAFDEQGRLYAHHDEGARVYQLDPETGAVVLSFRVGRASTGDYEGIAAAAGHLFLVDSDGFLLEFLPGSDGEPVGYRATPTQLGSRCEVEGLGYDAASRSLLIPCKTARARSLRGRLVVYSFSLDRMELDPRPRIDMPHEDLEAVGLDEGFSPSAVEVDPETGTILVASAQEHAIVELASDGRLVGAKRIGRRQLPQVEGLAISPDGTLFLASEGGSRGRIASFARRPSGVDGF